MIDRFGLISELVKEVLCYVMFCVKIFCLNEKKVKVMEIIVCEVLKMFDYEGLIDIDGIRIENGDWWIFFCLSGIELIMCIILEVYEEEKVKELMGKVERLVKKVILEV